MFNGLLADSGWFLDLAFFLILILGTALGAYRGFVAGVCKLAGKIVSLIFAFTFCVAFANFLELCFHMTTAITNGLAGAIENDPNLAAALPFDATGAGLGAALNELGITGIAQWFINISFKNVELIPAGTTAATLIASVLAKWISIVISFILLVILVRLVAKLISKGFDALKEHVGPLKMIDQVLGAILGFAKACVFIFIILLTCNWLPIDGLHAYIESSNIVGAIFRAEWFADATSYAISGQWFNDYIKQLLPAA